MNGTRAPAGIDEHDGQLRALQAVEFLLAAALGLADERECARIIVTGLPRIVDSEVGAIALEGTVGEEWVVIGHMSGSLSDDALTLLEQEAPALCEIASRGGRQVLTEEAETLSAGLVAAGLSALAVCPLRTASGCLGALLVGQKNASIDGPRGLEGPLLTALQSPLSLGIENLRLRNGLEARVERRTQELRGHAEMLDRASRENRQLLNLTNATVGTTRREQLFDAVAGSLADFIEYDRSALLRYREDTDDFEVYALSGPLADLEPPVGSTIERGASQPAWTAIDEARAVLTDDLAADARSESDRTLAENGLRAQIVVPLVTGQTTLGVLGVTSRSPGAYTPEDAARLERVAMQIALAVEKMLAFEEISRLSSQLERENLYLQEEIRTEHDFGEIVGEAPALVEVMRAVRTVGPTDATVLISGETGTGKELIARAIHDASKRTTRALVKVNCAAIPGGLVESELFGHEKGAFTGALARRMGRFQLADHGTIFLDEIGELPLDLQSKLLRVLQEGEFERLGSAETRTADVRVIAATNRDLGKEVAAGRFRSDLFYRLNVFPIAVPPLRERGDDVKLLVRHFTDVFSRKFDREIEAIPRATLDRLAAYDWPGNVRELRNVVERAVILSPGDSLEIGAWFDAAGEETAPMGSLRMDDVQRDHILAVLGRTSWKVSGPGGAAEKLGLKPTTLEARMKKLGIERPA